MISKWKVFAKKKKRSNVKYICKIKERENSSLDLWVKGRGGGEQKDSGKRKHLSWDLRPPIWRNGILSKEGQNYKHQKKQKARYVLDISNHAPSEFNVFEREVVHNNSQTRMFLCLCSQLNNVPPLKNVCTSIPRTCEYVSMHGVKDSADVTKLKILRWGEEPGLSGWAQYNHKGPYKKEERRHRQKEE